MSDQECLTTLTDRPADVLDWKTELSPRKKSKSPDGHTEMDYGGKTSAEVTMILSISENTVTVHQKHMLPKIHMRQYHTQIACYIGGDRFQFEQIGCSCVSDVGTGCAELTAG
jgi:DNA-binding HTH domain-containing proteins